MSLVWEAYVIGAAVAIPVIGLLAYLVAANHDDVRGTRWFLVTLLLTAAWLSFHLVMLLTADRAIQWIARTIAEKAAVFSFLAWVLFASQYSGTDFHRHWAAKVLLGVVFALTAIPSFVAPFDGWLYADRTYVSEPFSYIAVEPGAGYVFAVFLILILVGASHLALIRYLFSTPRNSGVQLVLLVLGSLSLPVMTVAGKVGLFPADQLNHTTYGVLPFTLFATFALFRFRLFDIQPVARNAVVEELRDPVFVLDRDRRVADYNRAATAIVPTLPERVGEPFATVLPELAESLDLDGDEATARHATVVDGTERCFSATVSRVDVRRGEKRYWHSVVLRDVTDLERSRWQLSKQNERLDQVASTIAHDLRNPIGVGDGYAELLSERLDAASLSGEELDRAREDLAKIRSTHDRMESIVDDVLALARKGKIVEETESVSTADAAKVAWGNVDHGAATLRIADDRIVEADRSKLLSVLENLFRNAVDHGDDDDVTVEIGISDRGFYVADDGPGVPPEDRDRIFEYGYSGSDEGTGLGLAIVRTITESHGWTVALDDEADGARFVFDTGGDPTAVAPDDDGRTEPAAIPNGSAGQ